MVMVKQNLCASTTWNAASLMSLKSFSTMMNLSLTERESSEFGKSEI
jgi:hypothetical protein